MRSLIGPLPRTLAFTAGILDTIQIFGYILEVSPMGFQALSILLKAVLCVRYADSIRNVEKVLPFLIVTVGLETFSFLFSPYQVWSGLAQLAAFGISIALTASLIKGTKGVVEYAQGFAQSLTVISVLYLLFAAMGRLEDHFGRLGYFGAGHPNLGAEIGAIAIVTACMSFRLPALAVRIPIYVGPVLLMQGRAGILTCIVAIAIRGAVEFKHIYKRQNDLLIIGAGTLLPLAFILSMDKLFNIYENVFRVNDAERGEGTGFVGRDELWLNAWKFFQENPFVGRGPTAYEFFDLLGPHNFYMWGFSTLGMMFSFTLFILYRNFVRAFKYEFDLTIIACSGLVMTFFNDRLFALSPYPFVIFIIICSLGTDRMPNTGRANNLPLRTVR